MQARLFRAVVLVLLIAPLGSCGDDAGVGGSSGIAGRAVLGPICPVEREGTPCPDRPYGGARLRITERGTADVVTTVTTDDEGRFVVQLPPGEYVVDGGSTQGRPLPFAGPVDVTVHSGQYTTVMVAFDTGIR